MIESRADIVQIYSQEEYRTLQTKYRESTIEVEELNKIIVYLKKELKDIFTVQKEKAALEIAIKKQKDVILALSRSTLEFGKHLFDQENEKDSQQIELKEEIQHLRNTVEELVKDNRKLEQKVQQIQKLKEASYGAFKKLEEKCNGESMMVVEAKKKVLNLRNQRDELKATVEKQQKQLKAMREESNNLLKENNDLFQELKRKESV